MFTAKDMHNILQQHGGTKGYIIDNWLREVVLPTKLMGYKLSFNCPSGVTLTEAAELCSMRGFNVKIWADYKISIDIPPQGE